MYLAIDNCTNYASVCIYDNAILFESTWKAGQQHTTTTLPTIEKAMLSLERNFNELKGIICAKGPGSFNGARAGMSLGIGLSMSLGIPITYVSAMEENALPFKNCGMHIVCLMSAGRGEVYASIFKGENERLLQTKEEYITTLEKVLEGINERTLFCGEYVNEIGQEIKERLGDLAIIATPAENVRRASFLIEAGLSRLNENAYETPSPLYLRKPPITESKKSITLDNQQKKC